MRSRHDRPSRANNNNDDDGDDSGGSQHGSDGDGTTGSRTGERVTTSRGGGATSGPGTRRATSRTSESGSSAPAVDSRAFAGHIVFDQFADPRGLGRVALGALALGVACGAHVMGAAVALYHGNFGIVSTAQAQLSGDAIRVCVGAMCHRHSDRCLCRSRTNTCRAPNNCLAPRRCRVREQLRWCLYIIVVCSYHLSEFLVTAKHHPEDVSFNSEWRSRRCRHVAPWRARAWSRLTRRHASLNSRRHACSTSPHAGFLLFEQREYVIAILASWTEFWIEWLYFPQTKEGLVTLLAIAVVVSYAGQAIRSLAMHQAGVAFTHLIAAERRPEHKLVTSGLYR